MISSIAYIVLLLNGINLLRIFYFLIGSDLFDIKKSIQNSKYSKNNKSNKYYGEKYRPLVTVIVPAHNEERTIERNLLSVVNSTYKRVQLIIVNDSSTDNTEKIIKKFRRDYSKKLNEIRIIKTNVRGKAKALNKGLVYARGSLIMCLDADSTLEKESLSKAVRIFREKKLVTLSANVKIHAYKGLLNWIQRIEYLICYQMKKTETLTNTQYIIGGIGSMFRRRVIKYLGYYDTDTITEDIDLSMKILERYGTEKRIGYNPEVVVYTEAVINFKGLLSQRFRWKYGRYQVFLKRKGLFFSKSRKYNRFLSWIYLPYALYAEVAYLLEPLTFILIFYLLLIYKDYTMLLGSVVVFLFYTAVQILGASTGYSFKERFILVLYSPIAFIGMYIISAAEYYATIKGIVSLRKLLKEYRTGASTCEWQHVERAGVV